MSANANTVQAQKNLAEARKNLAAAEQEANAARSLNAEIGKARDEARQAFEAADSEFNSAMDLGELKAAENRRSAAEADMRRAEGLIERLGERLETALDGLKAANMRHSSAKTNVLRAIQEDAMAAILKNRDCIRLLTASAMLGENFVKLEAFGLPAMDKAREEIWREIEGGAT